MKKLIIRLDDACEKMNTDNWKKVENLLDKFKIKPLVGVIPHCEDPMVNSYRYNENFWEIVKSWIKKGWIIAMHGYNHVYSSNNGGINPVNNRSEFAGESFETQTEKIKRGIEIFRKNGINPKVFFAPSHTFDENTLVALEQETDIRVISDTIAWDCYFKDNFTFVPQQSGRLRALPFKVTTYCLHPNTMSEHDFVELEQFIQKYCRFFVSFDSIVPSKRKYSLLDKILHFLYFLRKKGKNHAK